MSTPASNRTTPHHGKTAHRNKDSIGILIDAELKDPNCCQQVAIFSHCCSSFNKERSYLYLRENSLEYNVSFNVFCGCCLSPDFTYVQYFDRAPYAEECTMGPPPFCCCSVNTPKLEVIEPGCMICFQRVNLCGDQQMILMPFESMPVPCCCLSNRVTTCDNNCGCCGPITGNPKAYYGFFPQPTDPVGFVQVAQSVMIGVTAATVVDNGRDSKM